MARKTMGRLLLGLPRRSLDRWHCCLDSLGRSGLSIRPTLLRVRRQGLRSGAVPVGEGRDRLGMSTLDHSLGSELHLFLLLLLEPLHLLHLLVEHVLIHHLHVLVRLVVLVGLELLLLSSVRKRVSDVGEVTRMHVL